MTLFILSSAAPHLYAGISPRPSELEKIIDVSHSPRITHCLMGNSHLNKGQTDEAISEYRTVLELDPDCAEAGSNLAVAYYAKGYFDLASNYSKKLLK